MCYIYGIMTFVTIIALFVFPDEDNASFVTIKFQFMVILFFDLALYVSRITMLCRNPKEPTVFKVLHSIIHIGIVSTWIQGMVHLFIKGRDESKMIMVLIITQCLRVFVYGFLIIG